MGVGGRKEDTGGGGVGVSVSGAAAEAGEESAAAGPFPRLVTVGGLTTLQVSFWVGNACFIYLFAYLLTRRREILTGGL